MTFDIECFLYKNHSILKWYRKQNISFVNLIGRPKIVEYAAYFIQMCFSTNIYVKLGRFWTCNLCAHAFDNCNSLIAIYIYVSYNTIANYFLIVYELSNLDHLLGVVSQTKVSGGNRIHYHHANSLAHYPIDYQGTLSLIFVQSFYIKNHWFRVVKTIYFHSFYYCFICKDNHMFWTYYKFNLLHLELKFDSKGKIWQLVRYRILRLVDMSFDIDRGD